MRINLLLYSCSLNKSSRKSTGRDIAQKLGNRGIAQITFHTVRHWKAAMESQRTKDILHVMKLLGHKNIKNTLVCTQLVNFESEDIYICRAAKTAQEAKDP